MGLNRRSRWWRTRWADVVLAMLGNSVRIVLDHDGQRYSTLRRYSVVAERDMLEGRIPDGLREHFKGRVSEVAVVNSKGDKIGLVRSRSRQWRFEVGFDRRRGRERCRCIGRVSRERRWNGPKCSGNIFYRTFVEVIL